MIESELFTPVQTELMFKLSDYFEQLDEEELDHVINIIKDELDELSDEDKYHILQECRRLKGINEELKTAEEFIKKSEEQLNLAIPNSYYIPGFD